VVPFLPLFSEDLSSCPLPPSCGSLQIHCSLPHQVSDFHRESWMKQDMNHQTPSVMENTVLDWTDPNLLLVLPTLSCVASDKLLSL
jgi:hypothetical protein